MTLSHTGSIVADLKYLIHDFETFSEADLKKVGAWRYSKHQSTQVMCLAWKYGTWDQLAAGECPTYSYASRLRETKHGGDFLHFLDILQEAKRTRRVKLVAHNAMFERFIIQNVLARKCIMVDIADIPPDRFICTAAQAAALSLPRKLEDVGRVLKLSVQKDKEGHRLMMKHSKPRKPTKNNPSTRHEDEDEFLKVVDYCVTDIDVEAQLLLSLPRLCKTERRVWALDQKINQTGFAVDRKAVKNVLEMIDSETARLKDQIAVLTNGRIQSTKQTQKLHAWMRQRGVALPNLQAKTVAEALDAGLATGRVAKVLRVSQSLSKASTAKYKVFEIRSRGDGRLRDSLLYHGAGPGRWSGAGVQPQNFPRGTLKPEALAELIPLIHAKDLETIRLLFGDPMTAFSNALRSMIRASEGTVLDVADYSAIEARVLFWVAKHVRGCEAFANGAKMYEELAAAIFNKNVKTISEDSIERFVGKQATLGCGYQMGWEKFIGTCENFGQEVSEEIAKRAVYTYRKKHKPVVKLWDNFERAAIAAIRGRGKGYTINRVTWRLETFGGHPYLTALLPSGRKIGYFRPSVRKVTKTHGKGKKKKTWTKDTVHYWGQDSKTRKWVEESTYGGKLTENVVQGIARDLMAASMLRIDETGKWAIVLTVHDELVAERDVFAGGTLDEFKKLMEALPDWAEGCPVKVAGFSTERYRK